MHTNKPGNNSSDLCRVLDALEFAAAKHRNQRRKDTDASPYINHPIALARVLSVEGGIEDVDVLCAALLHDTIEDTETTAAELESRFGAKVGGIVMEVTDDKSLPKEARKALQVHQAHKLTREAQLVKLADKICNLRDIKSAPPANWSVERRLQYFDWARSVVEGLSGVHEGLELVFAAVHAAGPFGNVDDDPKSEDPEL